MAELRHPHIVKYLGHGFVSTEDGLSGYIVTELIEGEDLYTHLARRRTATPAQVDERVGEPAMKQAAARGPLPLATALLWARQIGSAVAHLHKHGVIHRDIKESNVGLPIRDSPLESARASLGLHGSATPPRRPPRRPPRLRISNHPLGAPPSIAQVMITADEGHAVLIDLGLSVRCPPASLLRRGLERRFGVRGYRAPEVNRQEAYGAAVDIFAFGRVLYNLLAAIIPPPRDDSLRAWRAWLVDLSADGLLALCTRRSSACWAYETLFCEAPTSPRWPAPLRELVSRCVASNPTERPDAARVMRQLDEVDLPCT